MGGKYFEYSEESPESREKVKVIHDIARQYGVGIKAAALIPCASRPSRLIEDNKAMVEVIPQGFWQALRNKGLISP